MKDRQLRIAINIYTYLTLTAFLPLISQGCQSQPNDIATFHADDNFSGERALQYARYQVELGPRIPGTTAHAQVVEWIESQLIEFGWSVEVQEPNTGQNRIRNILARSKEGDRNSGKYLLLGAHYDSRIYADRDPEPGYRKMPVPGANDGASGVAVLLELAKVIPPSERGKIQIVFFDAEDNGDIPGWDWILGSTAYVAGLDAFPECVVIVDMVGDSDLNLYQELNSDPELTEEIWEVAEGLGYANLFLASPKYRILDDHIPFINAGIRAVDIIDFDYPYWHTTEDTIDKISSESLQAVGETLLEWMRLTSECQGPF